MRSVRALIKIRKATISDVPDLVALNRDVQAAHANAFPERFRRDAPDDVVAGAFRAMMDAAGFYWLLAETDQPVAFLSAEFRDREESWCLIAQRACYLAAIVVAPEFRRHGIGRMLVTELAREAVRRGVSGIELDVWAFNGDARAAFAKLGFRSLAERMRLAVMTPDTPPDRTSGTSALRPQE